VVGRYTICDAIASGGMATVFFGRLRGPAGFSRTVAIKRLHPEFAESPELVAALLDEARLVSRIQHPNVVAPLDVVAETGRLLLVMEYIHGASLSKLMRRKSHWEPVPPAIAAAILLGALRGLHAAHEAKGEEGEPLGIVHRDVSPQNILVGVDGLARVADFGVAKARGRLQTTREGQIKGKLAYMAPEQIRSGEVSRKSDVFAAGIVMWETLCGRRLFEGDNEGQVLSNVLGAAIEPPRSLRPDLPEAVDELVMRALAREPDDRYPTAKQFADAIEATLEVASASAVGEWVSERARDTLERRAKLRTAIERGRKSAPSGNQADEPTRTATVERPSGESASGTTETAYEAPTEPIEQPRLKSSGAARLGLGLLVLLLAGGLVWSFGWRGDGAPELSQAGQGGEATAPESSGVASTEAATAESSTSKYVTIEVVTTPPGAQLQVGNQTYGPTPTEISLERGPEAVSIKATLAGYRPAEREVVPDQAQRIEVLLLRLPRGPRPAGKPAQPEPTSPPAGDKDFWRFE
jgi:serine/threonine-protein kinase